MKEKMIQVKNGGIGFAFVIAGSLIYSANIPVISIVGLLGLCLVGWYFILKKGIIGYERAKEERLEKNDARYIKLVQQLRSNVLIANNELNPNCLQHGILARFIKQLESGAAQSLADCK